MKQTRIRRISDKRAAQLKEYYKVLDVIMNTPVSDYSGESQRNSDRFDPHHIDGRRGKRLYNAFNIIVCLHSEHEYFQAHNTPELKEKLAGIVKEIRLRQGFSQEGSGAIKELQEGE